MASENSPPPRKRSDFHTAMQAHGFSKGSGKHKRHPSTDVYKAPTVDQVRYQNKM